MYVCIRCTCLEPTEVSGQGMPDPLELEMVVKQTLEPNPGPQPRGTVLLTTKSPLSPSFLLLGRVSGSLGWFQICQVTETDLELSDPPASNSHLLGFRCEAPI